MPKSCDRSSTSRQTKIMSVVRVASGNSPQMCDFFVFGYHDAAIGPTSFPEASEFAHARAVAGDLRSRIVVCDCQCQVRLRLGELPEVTSIALDFQGRRHTLISPGLSLVQAFGVRLSPFFNTSLTVAFSWSISDSVATTRANLL